MIRMRTAGKRDPTLISPMKTGLPSDEKVFGLVSATRYVRDCRHRFSEKADISCDCHLHRAPFNCNRRYKQLMIKLQHFDCPLVKRRSKDKATTTTDVAAGSSPNIGQHFN
jgi:hypothetical protein